MGGLLQQKTMDGDDIFWLQMLREQGRDNFILQGVPTSKTEAWKYTKLRILNVDDFEFATATHVNCDCHNHNGNCSCQDKSEHFFSPYVYRYKNGMFIPPHPRLPEGVEVMTLIEALRLCDEGKNKLNKLIDISKFPFAALNTAYVEEGLFVCVHKNVHLDMPLFIDVCTHADDKNLFYNLRNLIVVETGAKAQILEHYHYCGKEKSRYFINVVNEIYVGREAQLSHYKLQDDAFKSCHISLSAVQVKANGRYENFCCQKGADIGRNEVVVKLLEEGAFAKVDAAYKMSGWATIDTTTDIQHLSPNTHSEQLVKGVVDGDSKGVFQGRIHIAPNAQQTEGKQFHQALLLSDNAEIDVKPELEIFADDVKCSHGAASGELDSEQLFYMRSRGIDAKEAKQILVEAFLDDVLLRISDDNTREWFLQHL